MGWKAGAHQTDVLWHQAWHGHSGSAPAQQTLVEGQGCLEKKSVNSHDAVAWAEAPVAQGKVPAASS